MYALHLMRRAAQATARSTGVFLRDVGCGLLEVGHNSLALVGLAAVAIALFGVSRPELHQQVEAVALDWLQSRHEQRELAAGNALVGLGELEAVARATATDPESLSQEQAAVAQWLARRYRVAAEPVAALVHEAWASGQRAALEPTLILAVIAIESSFNPFAQSPVGAQGLMQVMTHVHDDKYSPFGGTHAAFDPITNLRVGVQVLKECIARTGSVAQGLRHYVGAALLETDGGYASRVLAEQAHLRAVAQGKRVPVNVPNTASAPEKVASLYLGAPAPAR
jgi:hypothetical protein